MLQSVDQRVDQGLLVEQPVPVWQIEIGGDDRRDAVVALIHQPEERVGLLRLDRQIAELIDQQRLHAAELGHQPGGGAIGERGVEFIEQDLRIVESAAMAVEAGLTQQPQRQARFAGAGLADEQDIVGPSWNSRPASVWIWVLLTPGWRSKGKLSSDQ